MRVYLNSNMQFATSMIKKQKKRLEKKELRRWMKEFMELKKSKKIQRQQKVKNLIPKLKEEKIQKEKKELFPKELYYLLDNMMSHHQQDLFHQDKQE